MAAQLNRHPHPRPAAAAATKTDGRSIKALKSFCHGKSTLNPHPVRSYLMIMPLIQTNHTLIELTNERSITIPCRISSTSPYPIAAQPPTTRAVNSDSARQRKIELRPHYPPFPTEEKFQVPFRLALNPVTDPHLLPPRLICWGRIGNHRTTLSVQFIRRLAELTSALYENIAQSCQVVCTLNN